MWKKVVSFAVLSVFLMMPFTGYAEEYDVNHDLVAEIAGYLAMDGHSEHDLATCVPKNQYYNDITDMLNDGMTKDEILDEYKMMYGEEGFRAPDRSGFSLTAWVLPFIALGAGSFVFVVRVKNSVKTSRSEEEKARENESVSSDETEDDIFRSIIEEEKRKHL